MANGIADSRGSQIQVNSLSAINSRPDVDVSSLGRIPSFDSFMDAFRKGIITADDIKKRAIVGTTGDEATREENIARKGAAEQTQIDIGEVRPRQREATVAQLEGATQQQTLMNDLNSPNQDVRFKAREEFADRQLEAQATEVYKTPQPDIFKSTEQKPEDFDTWVVRQANAFEGSDQARAQFVNSLRTRGEKGEEYSEYKKAIKEAKVLIPKGTPEYKEALRDGVAKKLTYEKLQDINFKIMQEAGTARAKAAAEAPAAQMKQQATSRDSVLAERHRSDPLKRFVPQAEAFNKVAEIRKAGNFNNATDVSILYNYVKLLDPASAVREGEINITENTIPSVRALWNKFQGLWSDSNKILDDETRNNFFGEIDKLKAGAEATIRPEFERLKEVAEAGGVPLTQVFTKPELDLMQQPPKPAAPAAPAATPAAPAAPGGGGYRLSPQEDAGLPTYSSPKEIPSTVRVFRTPDGRKLLNPAYRP